MEMAACARVVEGLFPLNQPEQLLHQLLQQLQGLRMSHQATPEQMQMDCLSEVWLLAIAVLALKNYLLQYVPSSHL